MIEHSVLALAAIGLLGIACQWLAWWVKLPAIVFLLLVGIFAGPVTGLLNPDALFGDLLFPIVSLAVAVILFEGSLTLRLEQIKGLATVVWNLVTIGAIVTWLTIAAATRILLNFPWDLALLFGAIVVVTGPTVIIPLLRTMRPTANLANILRWEGIVIDPLGALLAVLVFEVIISGQSAQPWAFFATTVFTGVAGGAVGAIVLGTLLKRHIVPEYLHNVTTLALVLGVFAIANSIKHESGLLAVTVMGLGLANIRGVAIEDILDFKESLSILLISLLFIVLAARIEFAQFEALGWGVLALLAVILLVVRPVAVLLSTIGSKLNWRERAVLGWVAPRGIVAAAVSALFALRLTDLGFDQAPLLVPLTFAVILGTVVVHSATARAFAGWLGVSEPEPRGVLIVGAGKVPRAIAKALAQNGFRVLLGDTSWDNIRTARMEGFQTYFGNVVSEHADRHLDLVGIGRLLAMSQRPALNGLACVRYKSEFGANNVYALQTAEEKSSADKHVIAGQYRGQRLFGEELTHAKLASLLSQGAEIRTTRLTQEFDFAAYKDKYADNVIPLFALDTKKRLQPFTAEKTPEPAPGWEIVSLIPSELLEAVKSARAARTAEGAGRDATAEAGGGLSGS